MTEVLYKDNDEMVLNYKAISGGKRQSYNRNVFIRGEE